MKQKRVSLFMLVLGMAFLTIGFATDNTIFTYISIAFVLISLITGGRWLRKRH